MGIHGLYLTSFDDDDTAIVHEVVQVIYPDIPCNLNSGQNLMRHIKDRFVKTPQSICAHKKSGAVAVIYYSNLNGILMTKRRIQSSL
jgi:hypothetical protein